VEKQGVRKKVSDGSDRRSLVAWSGRYGPAILVILVGIWIFIELADEVLEGGTLAFDRAMLLKMRNPCDPSDPLGPKWVEELFRDFTALGSAGVLTLVTLAAAGFLAMERRLSSVILLLVAVGGGVLLVSLLKLGFDRPRPDLVAHGAYVQMSSFPSGHSKLSAVAYLTLGGLLTRMHPRPWVRIYLLFLAMLLTFLVGISRVYLGVHWPTDVLAGWTAGAAWALLCWLMAGWLQRRDEHGESVLGRE
jgi:undecaprenyl-diphosphatase